MIDVPGGPWPERPLSSASYTCTRCLAGPSEGCRSASGRLANEHHAARYERVITYQRNRQHALLAQQAADLIRGAYAGTDPYGRPMTASWTRGAAAADRHSHQIPGIWDCDNGPAAGHVCATCARAGRYIATPDEAAAASAIYAIPGRAWLDRRGLPHTTAAAASQADAALTRERTARAS